MPTVGGPSPPCGDTDLFMRRLLGADPLRSNNAEGRRPVAALRRH
jgi:hypothetical protein